MKAAMPLVKGLHQHNDDDDTSVRQDPQPLNFNQLNILPPDVEKF